MEFDEFGPDYVYAINSQEISENWPNLALHINFEFRSKKRKGNNCVGFAIGDKSKEDDRDLDMLVFAERFKLDKSTLDHSVEGYAKIFQEYFGFELCDNYNYEKGFEKIALFEDVEKDFSHVAKMIGNVWFSKMGTFEDIEHKNLDALGDGLYGVHKLYMKRRAIDEK